MSSRSNVVGSDMNSPFYVKDGGQTLLQVVPIAGGHRVVIGNPTELQISGGHWYAAFDKNNVGMMVGSGSTSSYTFGLDPDEDGDAEGQISFTSEADFTYLKLYGFDNIERVRLEANDIGTPFIAMNQVQILTVQQAAVADATGAGDVVAQLNALLARLRAHGLIAT